MVRGAGLLDGTVGSRRGTRPSVSRRSALPWIKAIGQGNRRKQKTAAGVIDDRQVGGRAAAVNRGQGLASRNRLDDVRRRGVKILLAEQPSRHA